jgi:hypothetical protein
MTSINLKKLEISNLTKMLATVLVVVGVMLATLVFSLNFNVKTTVISKALTQTCVDFNYTTPPGPDPTDPLFDVQQVPPTEPDCVNKDLNLTSETGIFSIAYSSTQADIALQMDIVFPVQADGKKPTDYFDIISVEDHYDKGILVPTHVKGATYPINVTDVVTFDPTGSKGPDGSITIRFVPQSGGFGEGKICDPGEVDQGTKRCTVTGFNTVAAETVGRVNVKFKLKATAPPGVYSFEGLGRTINPQIGNPTTGDASATNSSQAPNTRKFTIAGAIQAQCAVGERLGTDNVCLKPITSADLAKVTASCTPPNLLTGASVTCTSGKVAPGYYISDLSVGTTTKALCTVKDPATVSSTVAQTFTCSPFVVSEAFNATPYKISGPYTSKDALGNVGGSGTIQLLDTVRVDSGCVAPNLLIGTACLLPADTANITTVCTPAIVAPGSALTCTGTAKTGYFLTDLSLAVAGNSGSPVVCTVPVPTVGTPNPTFTCPSITIAAGTLDATKAVNTSSPSGKIATPGQTTTVEIKTACAAPKILFPNSTTCLKAATLANITTACLPNPAKPGETVTCSGTVTPGYYITSLETSIAGNTGACPVGSIQETTAQTFTCAPITIAASSPNGLKDVNGTLVSGTNPAVSGKLSTLDIQNGCNVPPNQLVGAKCLKPVTDVKNQVIVTCTPATVLPGGASVTCTGTVADGYFLDKMDLNIVGQSSSATCTNVKATETTVQTFSCTPLAIGAAVPEGPLVVNGTVTTNSTALPALEVSKINVSLNCGTTELKVGTTCLAPATKAQITGTCSPDTLPIPPAGAETCTTTVAKGFYVTSMTMGSTGAGTTTSACTEVNAPTATVAQTFNCAPLTITSPEGTYNMNANFVTKVGPAVADKIDIVVVELKCGANELKVGTGATAGCLKPATADQISAVCTPASVQTGEKVTCTTGMVAAGYYITSMTANVNPNTGSAVVCDIVAPTSLTTAQTFVCPAITVTDTVAGPHEVIASFVTGTTNGTKKLADVTLVVPATCPTGSKSVGGVCKKPLMAANIKGACLPKPTIYSGDKVKCDGTIDSGYYFDTASLKLAIEGLTGTANCTISANELAFSCPEITVNNAVGKYKASLGFAIDPAGVVASSLIDTIDVIAKPVVVPPVVAPVVPRTGGETDRSAELLAIAIFAITLFGLRLARARR